MMPPPDVTERLPFETELARTAKGRPDRFAFLNGGGSLNPMIQQAVKGGGVPPDLQSRFEAKAAEIAQGGAVGFGEMTALHLSFQAAHPYEEAPPDHPLFLRLAALAAQFDVAIDFHMEAVAEEMPTPRRFLTLSPSNPPTLRENISAFERLLSHNPKARVVWAHVGWDNTGHMTVELLRRLLQGHSNLYMQIKIEEIAPTFPQHYPLDRNGNLRPEWLDLIRSFPDRFVLGSDALYAEPDQYQGRMELTRALLGQLPPTLARQVGYDNAIRIYKLK